MVLAQVRERHAVSVALSGIEVKRAQIHPCPSAHLLVHSELRGHTLMPYGVVGIVNALLQRLVTHVNGVAPSLGYGRSPYHGALMILIVGGLRLSRRALFKGVLHVYVHPWVESETR